MIKLIGRDANFAFKPIKIFYPINCGTILTYELLSSFTVSIPQPSIVNKPIRKLT